MIITGLDCETTGLDIYHGSAQPFIVTTCNEEGDVTYWEWDVDPYTREVAAPKSDLREVRDVIEGSDLLVIQNAIFDGSVLKWFFRKNKVALRWDWSKVRDTLYNAHILGSNYANDLTSQLIRYLSIDISKYESEVETAVKSARTLVNKKEFKERHGEVVKASEKSKNMPSIKQYWRSDYWLPRAVAILENFPEDHEWYSTVAEYANVDSSVLIPLYKAQREMLEDRDLVKISEVKHKLLPIVYTMEQKGITVSGDRLEEQLETFRESSKSREQVCTKIAKTYDYELKLPKSGNNRSILNFAFGERVFLCGDCGKDLDLKAVEKGKAGYKCECGGIGKYRTNTYLDLPPIKYGKTGPSLDKYVIEEYEATLNPRSKQFRFIKELKGKRKCDTSISYLESYGRFWKAIGKGWYLLHPNLNVTGTSTLRWSSSNPNEQNISNQEDYSLRYSFGPRPGRVWFSLDAQNIELRIPAYESEEPELIYIFEQPNDPPYYGSTHLLNFSTVYPDIWNRVLKEVGIENVGPTCKERFASTWYKWCKNGGFAIQYGAAERTDELGTADKAFHREGSHALLKARFKRLEKLNQLMVSTAEKFGYVETIPDKSIGSKRGYPLLCTRTKWGGIKPTVPLSYHVQGTAMWWMAMSQIRCQEYLDRYNEGLEEEDQIFIVAQIHDEILFETPEDIDPNVIEDLKRLMAKGGEGISVSTPVSVSYHPNNWKDKEEW